MSLSSKKAYTLPESSPLLITFCLGLLLLCLFVVLTSYREPSKIKKDRVMRSIAANFRRSASSKAPNTEDLKKLFKIEVDAVGFKRLSALINDFFSEDGAVKPNVSLGIRQLAVEILESNSSLELYCGVSASGINAEVPFEKLRKSEEQCQKISDIFRAEGIPGFNITSRVGFSLKPEEKLNLVVRGNSFKSSWQ